MFTSGARFESGALLWLWLLFSILEHIIISSISIFIPFICYKLLKQTRTEIRLWLVINLTKFHWKNKIYQDTYIDEEEKRKYEEKKERTRKKKNRKVSTIEALKRVRRFLLYFHASWLALELLLFSSTFNINFNIKERTMLLFFLLFLVIHCEYTIVYHLHINVWNVHIKAKKNTNEAKKQQRRSQKLQKLIPNKRQSELNVRGIVYLSAYP